MARYYIIRVIFSIVFGGLFALLGCPWWMAVLAGLLMLAWFFYAPRSGRYVVQQKNGIFALRRDERSQIIVAKAARNAFIFMWIVIAGIIIYFGSFARVDVPVPLLNIVLFLAIVIGIVSDLWLRRV